jgi:hypothetical protein
VELKAFGKVAILPLGGRKLTVLKSGYGPLRHKPIRSLSSLFVYSVTIEGLLEETLIRGGLSSRCEEGRSIET